MTVFVLHTKWAVLSESGRGYIISTAYAGVYSSLIEAADKMKRIYASHVRGYEVEETELNYNKVINRYNFDNRGIMIS